MNRWVLLLIMFGLIGTGVVPAEAQKLDIGKLQVDKTLTSTARQLAEKSTLIVYVWADSVYQNYPTSQRIGNARLVNYVQTLQVKEVVKGQATRVTRLLTTGVEPLPDAEDPLNDRYPGPLAEGSYVCFLQRVKGSDLYSLTGIWQGVYPVHDGKTIKLNRFGYTEFDQRTIAQLKQQINQWSHD